MTPEPERIAIHQAGHAVVQALVGQQRCTVTRVSLDGPHSGTWQGLSRRGESRLDREIMLDLYEFGLVTLAGIAAEERYLAQQLPETDPVVALSDLAEWHEAAQQVLGSVAREDLVSSCVMQKLAELFAEKRVRQVVEQLSAELLTNGTVEGELLQRLLAPLYP